MSISRKQFLKQAAVLGIGSAVLNQNLFAKNGTDNFSCVLDCSFDLFNNNYPGIGDDIQALEGENAIIYGKSGTIYKDENFTSDCPPSSVLCDDTNYASNLKYHVYYPNLPASTYASCPLPAFIFAHAGGFSDCSNLTSNPLDAGRAFCIEMAKRGYVSFNIEYRRGRTLTSGAISAQQLLAYYRGCQDFRGAIRSILKRQVVFPGEHTFQIDKNNIFLGGFSAGSFAALNAAYIQSSMIDEFAPGLSAAMGGGLDINLYYGNTSINYLPSIKGVLNCWGNFYIGTDSDIVSDIPGYFLSNNSYFPPAISFQGLDDTTAFPDKKGGFFPSGTMAGGPRTDYCLTNNASISSYTLPLRATGLGNFNVIACGAKELYRILRDSRINKPAELYLDSSMGHGVMDSNDDFGTGLPTASDVYKYIAHRAATFFQAVRTGIADFTTAHPTGIGDNVFLDCANARTGCTTGYSNACSTNHL